MTTKEQAELMQALRGKRGPGRPKAYRLADGTKVVGCTTVLSRFKEAGGLVHWAWQQGMDGKDYRDARDSAGGLGHRVHSLVDATIHGDQTWMVMGSQEYRAVEAFRAWSAQVELEILDTEVPGVSEEFRFGGTRDALARVNGELILMDWKSSNAVYREYIGQVAAYRQLAREQGHDVQGAGLVRFGKQYGDFTYHYWPSEVLDLGWKAFATMLELYQLDLKLKEVCR